MKLENENTTFTLVFVDPLSQCHSSMYKIFMEHVLSKGYNLPTSIKKEKKDSMLQPNSNRASTQNLLIQKSLGLPIFPPYIDQWLVKIRRYGGYGDKTKWLWR